MKTIRFIAIALLACCTVTACSGGGDAQQQQVPAAQPAQPAQPAVADSNAAQQPTTPPPASAQPQALPEAVNAFLKQHFPNAAVSYVETDNEHGGLEYDVTLNDGTEVDFDTNNQWEKVDCHTKAVPAALVPATIANYVKTNYQNLPITKIENKHYGYEIELSNGLDVKFNPNGQFMGIDD